MCAGAVKPWSLTRKTVSAPPSRTRYLVVTVFRIVVCGAVRLGSIWLLPNVLVEASAT